MTTTGPAGPAEPTGLAAYTPLHRLAHGRRLDTWDAFDGVRGTRCVVKVVRADRRHEPHVVEALRHEAEIVTTLAHPHLVRGYEAVDDPPAVVLETLRGATLGAVIEEGPIALPDVAELGLQLASVLGYLHHHDWLHLDVKPGNVVVDHGRAVLIDLSLSGRPGDQQPGAGTPGYLAPEQARGIGITAAADVFGLGVTLLECLTGEQPYGDEATWDSAPRRRGWSLRREPMPEPPEVPAGLPDDVRDLLRACVDLDAAHRPRLVDVSAVLGGVVGGVPGRPVPQTTEVLSGRTFLAEAATTSW